MSSILPGSTYWKTKKIWGLFESCSFLSKSFSFSYLFCPGKLEVFLFDLLRVTLQCQGLHPTTVWSTVFHACDFGVNPVDWIGTEFWTQNDIKNNEWIALAMEETIVRRFDNKWLMIAYISKFLWIFPRTLGLYLLTWGKNISNLPKRRSEIWTLASH